MGGGSGRGPGIGQVVLEPLDAHVPLRVGEELLRGDEVHRRVRLRRERRRAQVDGGEEGGGRPVQVAAPPSVHVVSDLPPSLQKSRDG